VGEAAVELAEESGQARLLAYVVPRNGQAPNARELRRHLRTKLPEPMVPARYVVLAELPLLASGKVNRRALAGTAGVVLTEQGIDTATDGDGAEAGGDLEGTTEGGRSGSGSELLRTGRALAAGAAGDRADPEMFEVELPVRTVFEEADAGRTGGSGGEGGGARAKSAHSDPAAAGAFGSNCGAQPGSSAGANWTNSPPTMYKPSSNASSMANNPPDVAHKSKSTAILRDHGSSCFYFASCDECALSARPGNTSGTSLPWSTRRVPPPPDSVRQCSAPSETDRSRDPRSFADRTPRCRRRRLPAIAP